MTGHALVDMISQNGEKLCVKLMNKTMYSLPSNYIRVAIWKTPIYIKIVGNIFPLHVKLCDSSFRQLYIVFFFSLLGCQNDIWIIMLHCSRYFSGSSYPPLDAVKPSNHQRNRRLLYKYPKVSWGRTTKLNDNSLPCNVLDVLVWCQNLSWLEQTLQWPDSCVKVKQ